jgi:hypothetical protein
MALHVDKLASELVDTLRGKALDGWDRISSFVTKQSKAIATQAAWITESRISGVLKSDDELFDFFVGQLKDSVESMAHAVAVLTVLTIEETWNAVVGIVWGAINTALTGAGLGFLRIPPVPPQA